MNTYEKKGWSRIPVPDGWVVDENEEPLAIHHPEGCGALQITAQSPRPLKPGERLDAYLYLRGYLRQTGTDIEETEAERYSRGGLDWARSEYEADLPDEGLLYWRVWLATNHESLVFVTYACREEDKSVERWVIDGIVNGLELL